MYPDAFGFVIALINISRSFGCGSAALRSSVVFYLIRPGMFGRKRRSLGLVLLRIDEALSRLQSLLDGPHRSVELLFIHAANDLSHLGSW